MANTPRFALRLDPADKEACRQAAARAKLPLSAWMRSTLLQAAALSERLAREPPTRTKRKA